VFDAIVEYLILVLVAGGPIFLLACVALAAYLRFRARQSWNVVAFEVLLTLAVLVVGSLVAWKLMPPIGPMLGIVHLPTVIACLIVLPCAVWWWSRTNDA
jgi:hypothetical protein